MFLLFSFLFSYSHFPISKAIAFLSFQSKFFRIIIIALPVKSRLHHFLVSSPKSSPYSQTCCCSLSLSPSPAATLLADRWPLASTSCYMTSLSCLQIESKKLNKESRLYNDPPKSHLLQYNQLMIPTLKWIQFSILAHSFTCLNWLLFKVTRISLRQVSMLNKMRVFPGSVYRHISVQSRHFLPLKWACATQIEDTHTHHHIIIIISDRHHLLIYHYRLLYV